MNSAIALLWHSGALLGISILALAIAAHDGANARRVTYGASLILCAAALWVALGQLLFAPSKSLEASLPLGLPWVGAHFALDPLSSFFLCLINLGGAAASLYALGYGRHESDPLRVLPFYPAFLAGMNLVVLAADAFSFLLSWEMMSLASWALVLAHHRDDENRRAAYVYLVMASFGTLALLLAFGLLAGPEGAYAFSAMRASGASGGLSWLVLCLALVGAGSKAGLFPLHVWLPLAHPAAPSHVSALMSGVMTKVAIYGFIRIAFDLLGAPAWWWGVPLLVAGAATALLGILYALMQDDLKRALAYSTIENVGLIFVALGLGLSFSAGGMKAAAALAITAALFHAFNHSLFKSLLFFGAGAVISATGTRSMEQLGGLLNQMPASGFLFLVGAFAISALPPFNGFVSEWLLFQGILLSPDLPQWVLKLLVPVAGALVALAAALTGACFVRIFGISFLGRPRSGAAQNVQEVDRYSIASMAGLAALCLFAGIIPGQVIDALAPVVGSIAGASMPLQSDTEWLTIIPIGESRSSYNGLLVFLFIVLSASLSALVIHRLASSRLRRAPAWDCGFPLASPATQYTASSFAQPIRRVFGTVFFRAREEVRMPPPGSGEPAGLRVTIRDPAWDWLFDPLVRLVDAMTLRLNFLQFLTVRRYLTLVFAALVLLLLVLAF